MSRQERHIARLRSPVVEEDVLHDHPLLALDTIRGLALVGEIKAALSGALDRGDANKLSDLVGADAAAMTAEPWPV